MEMQITCLGMECSDSMRAAVLEQAGKLERLNRRFSRCEVTIGLAHRHRSQGKVFHVEVFLQLPTRVIVASREPERDPGHTVFAVALRDAFRAVKKQLDAQELGKRQDRRRSRAAACFGLFLSISQIDKPVLVDALIPNSAVERFNVGVLNRISWAKEIQIHSIREFPLITYMARELRTVIRCAWVEMNHLAESPRI